VNWAEVAPAPIVTLVGTHATAGLELARDTAAPPVPAGAVRVTVPIPVWPAVTIELGLIETPSSAAVAGLIVMLNVVLTPE